MVVSSSKQWGAAVLITNCDWLLLAAKAAPSAEQGPGGCERTQGFHLIAGLWRKMHQSLSRPFAVGDTTLS